MIHALLSQLEHIVDDAGNQDEATDDSHHEVPSSPPPSYTERSEPSQATDNLSSAESAVLVDDYKSFRPPPIFLPDSTKDMTAGFEQDKSHDTDVEDITAVSISAESHADDDTVFGDDINPDVARPESTDDAASRQIDISEKVAVESRSSVSSAAATLPDPSSKTSVSLSSLLFVADDLYKRYPPMPSSGEDEPPSLDIGNVLGPSSVLFTWSQDPNQMLSNEEAEKIVRDGLSGVVLENDGSSEIDIAEEEEKNWKEQEERRVKREWDRAMRKRIVKSGLGVTVAVLVGLAAIALYSMERSANGNSNGKSIQEWRKSLGWVGGMLLGIGDRVIQVL